MSAKKLPHLAFDARFGRFACGGAVCCTDRRALAVKPVALGVMLKSSLSATSKRSMAPTTIFTTTTTEETTTAANNTMTTSDEPTERTTTFDPADPERLWYAPANETPPLLSPAICREGLLIRFEDLVNQLASGWRWHVANTEGIRDAWSTFERYYASMCSYTSGLCAAERKQLDKQSA